MADNVEGFELAFCGLVCSGCGAFTRGRCKGCHSPKPMHSRCPVKRCATEKSISSCADCTAFPDLHDCKKLNNFVSKVFGFIFRSDRIGNLNKIRDVGIDEFRRQARTR